MIIYTDVLSNDELLSDTYPITTVANGIILEVQAKMVTKQTENDFDIGGNPSEEAEDAEEGPMASEKVQVINVVDAHRLQEVSYGKEEYTKAMKVYAKKILTLIKEKDEAKATAWQTAFAEYFKGVLKNFDEYRFFTGESYEGMIILMFYKEEDGLNPVFHFIADGMKGEKV